MALSVLVTGCCGYLGSVVVRHLLENSNVKVVGLDSLRYHGCTEGLLANLGHPRFVFLRRDVRDLSSWKTTLDHADVVVHLAALVGAPVCNRFPDEARSVNADATVAIAKEIGSRPLVYANTNSGYGTTDGSRPCREDDAMVPISTYGQTKCEGEKAILQCPRGTSLRLATAFGPSPRMRFDLMVNDFTNRLMQPEGNFLLYEPHFLRNYVHVQDVARAVVHVLEEGLWGAYNVGLPEANLTKMQLATAICGWVGTPTDRIVVGDGRDPDQRNYCVDNSRLLSSGFRFAKTLEGGVRELAAFIPYLGDRIAWMRN